jgi:hypothetical protein
MPKTVDSFRFVSGVTRRVIETWIKMEEPRQIPWNPLDKPLSECTVALFSSGGIAMKSDRPFLSHYPENRHGERCEALSPAHQPLVCFAGPQLPAAAPTAG